MAFYAMLLSSWVRGSVFGPMLYILGFSVKFTAFYGDMA